MTLLHAGFFLDFVSVFPLGQGIIFQGETAKEAGLFEFALKRLGKSLKLVFTRGPKRRRPMQP